MPWYVSNVYKVFDIFLTGSDEHGLKIEQSAREAGEEPQEYVDKIVAGFRIYGKN